MQQDQVEIRSLTWSLQNIPLSDLQKLLSCIHIMFQVIAFLYSQVSSSEVCCPSFAQSDTSKMYLCKCELWPSAKEVMLIHASYCIILPLLYFFFFKCSTLQDQNLSKPSPHFLLHSYLTGCFWQFYNLIFFFFEHVCILWWSFCISFCEVFIIDLDNYKPS